VSNDSSRLLALTHKPVNSGRVARKSNTRRREFLVGSSNDMDETGKVAIAFVLDRLLGPGRRRAFDFECVECDLTVNKFCLRRECD